jgi:hypothetical protein
VLKKNLQKKFVCGKMNVLRPGRSLTSSQLNERTERDLLDLFQLYTKKGQKKLVCEKG